MHHHNQFTVNKSNKVIAATAAAAATMTITTTTTLHLFNKPFFPGQPG